METFKPITSFRGRAALLATACLIAPLMAGEPRGSSISAEGEVSRRANAVDKAQELLKKGDESYTAGRYAEAVQAYSQARDLIPNAPVSAELRDAATDRYAQASVEEARVLSRKGDVAGAKAAVDKVLAEGVAPNNPGAVAMRAQLDDPIRTNPALTAEHAKNVDQVRRLLYTAEGAYNLGKFDESKARYQDVLRIDPTNTAARRGMEKVSAAKSGYSKAAYDQTRAEMLGQVDSQWESQVPPAIDPVLTDPGASQAELGQISVRHKLDRIIIPKIALDQASLEEALDFLRLRASENDTFETDPAHKGLNFTVNLGPQDSPLATKIRSLRFDLQLSNVPVSQVLKYITDTTQTSFTTDDFSVLISPAGSASAELVTRTYRVPPDFISTLSIGTTSTAAPDPFAEAPKQGMIPQRLGAQEALMKQNVLFPEGASASYLSATNTLRVINTPTNQDVISQLIDSMTKTEPVMVVVKVTMIKVQQTRIEELGFDTILDNLGFAGNGWVPGSSKLNLSGGTTGNGHAVTDIDQPIGSTSPRPLTAGNRTGDSAISGNAIDNLINDPSGRQSSNPAPGILGLRVNRNDATVQTLMRGLNQSKGVDMMAQPSVVTRSGQQSSIQIVREFMYATEYEPPQLPNSSGGGNTNNDIFGFGNVGASSQAVTPATPTAFKKRDVGISLDVLPVVDPSKKYINLTLTPIFSDFDGFVNYGSPINTTANGPLGTTKTVEVTANAILMPIFSKQTFTTSIDVADGATIVAGSMMSEQVQNVEDQTPILGSIPIIGRIFKSKASKPVSTAILFLVHVELMDPTGHRYSER